MSLVQIHHVIPREHMVHPILQTIGFDIESPLNLMFMPTLKGADHLQLRPGRLIHDGGHPAYNRWVSELLFSNVSDIDDVTLLIRHLQRKLRQTDPQIPWI